MALNIKYNAFVNRISSDMGDTLPANIKTHIENSIRQKFGANSQHKIYIEAVYLLNNGNHKMRFIVDNKVRYDCQFHPGQNTQLIKLHQFDLHAAATEKQSVDEKQMKPTTQASNQALPSP